MYDYLFFLLLGGGEEGLLWLGAPGQKAAPLWITDIFLE